MKILHRIGWIGLTAVSAWILFGVTADLTADQRSGIPADHAGTFQALASQPFATVRASTPGVGQFITNLEVGYTLHELAFTILFLAVVLIPLRQRQPWAWYACWAIMIANIGYAATFGAHDHAILTRSLVAVIAVPVLLILCAPAVLRRDRHGPAGELRTPSAY